MYEAVGKQPHDYRGTHRWRRPRKILGFLTWQKIGRRKSHED
jgi:hypothetical protein